MSEIEKYFPKNYTPKQRTDTIVRLLESWSKNRERNEKERQFVQILNL